MKDNIEGKLFISTKVGCGHIGQIARVVECDNDNNIRLKHCWLSLPKTSKNTTWRLDSEEFYDMFRYVEFSDIINRLFKMIISI